MARKFSSGPLIISSHNEGKIREISALLAPFGAQLTSATEHGLPEPEETGKTFIENAVLKAHAAAHAADLPALADDSGLGANALDGAPGIYSARWGGPERNFDAAMAKLNAALGDGTSRGAVFISALALAWPDGHVETVEGRVTGTLVWPPRGSHGFGYDPMFQPNGSTQTFGEMEPEIKETFNHRAVAFKKLVVLCFEEP